MLPHLAGQYRAGPDLEEPSEDPADFRRALVVDNQLPILDAVAVGRYPDASDGTETAVALLWDKADASAGDAPAVAIVRGPAIVNRHDLVFAGTPDAAEVTAAHAALAAAGIIVR